MLKQERDPELDAFDRGCLVLRREGDRRARARGAECTVEWLPDDEREDTWAGLGITVDDF